jgi:hypothetical protein
MKTTASHESPEEIARFLDASLGHIRRLGMGGDEQMQSIALDMLRGVCRAAAHGRMPDDLRPRYQGMLRSLRPHVLRLQRAGRRVPAVVLSEVERAWKK